MWQPADIEDAIAQYPLEAADALAAIQLDSDAPRLEAAGFKAAAVLTHIPLEKLWVDSLDQFGLLESFALALAARGVPLDFGAIDIAGTNIPVDQLEKFIGRARSFRCRIVKEGQVVGSGVLVGPNSVLTAWHVIARAAPGDAQEPWPNVEVQLADGRRVEACVPAQFASECSVDEYGSVFPKSDDDVAGKHDVALVRLRRPAGALLGVAKLPDTPAPYRANASMILVHYPDGQDSGIGIGAVQKIRGVTARWAHTIGTAGGSSGGGCFDANLTLLGVHQGKDPRKRGRLVPTLRFHQDVRDLIANDQAPPRMWSLDGTAQGEYVIGRQAFFEAFVAARGTGRVRGIRIKRADAAGDLGGLPFSHRMLERMIARSPETRLCRLSFETMVDDLADEIARRASDAGVLVETVVSAQGVADGQSAPEAVGADRGRRIADAIDRQAGQAAIQIWFFIDHPAVAFPDQHRSTLEAFIDHAMHLQNIRLVIAGFEAVALPGLEFAAAPAPNEEGVRGLVAEIIAGFGRSDVRLFLADAAEAAGKTLSDERIEELISEALLGLPEVNGVYEPWVAADAGARLRPHILALFAPGDP